MKSFFSKLGVLLVAAGFVAVGCHDFAEDIREVNDSLKTEIESNQNSAEVSIQNLEKAIADLKSSMETTYATKEAVSNLETSLKNDAEAKFKQVQDALTSVNAAIATKADKATVDAAIKAANDAIADAKTSVASLDSKFTAQVGTINTALESLQRDLAAAQTTLALKADKSDVEKINNTVIKIQSDLLLVESTLKSADDALGLRIDANATSIAKNATDIVLVNTAIDEVKTRLTTAETTINALKEEDKKLSDKFDALAGRVSVLESDLDKAEAAIAECVRTSTFEAFKTEVANAYATKTDLKALEDKLAAEIEKRATKDELNQVKVDLEAAVEGAKKAAADALALAKAELKKDIADLATELNNKVDTINARIDAEVLTLGNRIDTEVQTLNTTITNVKAELEDKMADDKDELLKALADAKSDLEASISKNATDITSLFDSIAAHTAAREALAQYFMDQVNGVQSNLDLHIQNYNAKIALLEDADAAIRNEFAAADDALKAEVTAEYAQAIDAAKAALLAAHKASVDSLKNDIADLKAADVQLQNNIDNVVSQLNQFKSDVATIYATKQEMTNNLNTVRGEFAAADADLQDAIDDLDAAYKAADVLLQNQINALGSRLDAVEGDIDDILDEITAIKGRLDTVEDAVSDANDKAQQNAAAIADLRKQVDSLFNRVQSVVYKPTHADGKARVDYAEVTGVTGGLEGNSVITYKVYPKDLAQTIVKGFGENLLTLSFDLESVTKAVGSDLAVQSVVAGKKEGEIDVTFKAVGLGDDFYAATPTTSWSAALVFEYGAQNFSTTYTNLCKGDVRTYDFVLQNSTATHQTLEYPAVDPTKWTKTVLDGVCAKFTDGTTTYSPAEFFAIYPAAEALYSEADPAIVNPDGIFVTAENTDGYVTAYLDAAKATKDNFTAGKKLEVTYSFSYSTKTVSASDDIAVVDFPWTFEVNANDALVTYPLLLPYTSKDVLPIMPNVAAYFVNGTEEKTADELKAEGYKVEVTSLDAVKNVIAGTGTVDLFSLTDAVPTEVSLAQDANGVNLALAGHVGTILEVKYPYEYSIANDAYAAVESTPATVKIEKIMYEFTIDLGTYIWNYVEDAATDAVSNPSTCERPNANYVLATAVGNADVPADQTIEDVMNDYESIEIKIGLADADGNFVGTPSEYTVDGTNPWSSVASQIKFEDVTADDDKFDVQFSGLLWGKSYKMVAKYNRASSIVTVTANVNTVDRVREALNIDLGEVSKVFAANYILNHAVETEISLDLATRLVAGDYLGSTQTVDLAAVLAGATVNEYKTYVDDTHKYVDATTPIIAGIRPTADFSKVSYGYHYANPSTRLNYVTGNNIPKAYEYSTSFTTWYGQVINVVLDFKFTDPKYNFSPVHQYVQGDANTGYFAEVNAFYGYDSNGDLMSFSVNEVNLNASFDVVDADGNKMSASDMTDAKLSKKFSFVDNTDLNITFDPTNTIISYNGKSEYVTVNGYLTMSTSYTGTTLYYPIDETIFTGDFATFQVRKYDPISTFSVLPGCADQYQVINQAKVYTFNVLDNFSLTDVKGNELINPDLNDLTNAWAVGNDSNKISNGVSAGTIYNLAADYSFTVVQPTSGIVPTGISIDQTNGNITIDNTSQIDFANPVIISVNVTVKYPQGQTQTIPVQYTFGRK